MVTRQAQEKPHSFNEDTSARDEQARALLSIAERLENSFTTPQITEDALKDNSVLWGLFYDAAINNKVAGHKSLLDHNIIRLSHYVFSRNKQAQNSKNPDDIGVLVNLNREIALGLSKSAYMHQA